MSENANKKQRQDAPGYSKMLKACLVCFFVFAFNIEQPDANASHLRHLSLKAIKPHAIHIAPMDKVHITPEKVIW